MFGSLDGRPEVSLPANRNVLFRARPARAPPGPSRPTTAPWSDALTPHPPPPVASGRIPPLRHCGTRATLRRGRRSTTASTPPWRRTCEPPPLPPPLLLLCSSHTSPQPEPHPNELRRAPPCDQGSRGGPRLSPPRDVAHPGLPRLRPLHARQRALKAPVGPRAAAGEAPGRGVGAGSAGEGADAAGAGCGGGRHRELVRGARRSRRRAALRPACACLRQVVLGTGDTGAEGLSGIGSRRDASWCADEIARRSRAAGPLRGISDSAISTYFPVHRVLSVSEARQGRPSSPPFSPTMQPFSSGGKTSRDAAPPRPRPTRAWLTSCSAPWACAWRSAPAPPARRGPRGSASSPSPTRTRVRSVRLPAPTRPHASLLAPRSGARFGPLRAGRHTGAGELYLDLLPRHGKFPGAAHFVLQSGRRNADGSYDVRRAEGHPPRNSRPVACSHGASAGTGWRHVASATE